MTIWAPRRVPANCRLRSGPVGLFRLSGPLLKIYGTIVADDDQQIFVTPPLKFVIESTRLAGNAFAARPIASSRQNAPSALELDGNVDGGLVGGKRGDRGWQVPAYGVLRPAGRGVAAVQYLWAAPVRESGDPDDHQPDRRGRENDIKLRALHPTRDFVVEREFEFRPVEPS